MGRRLSSYSGFRKRLWAKGQTKCHWCGKEFVCSPQATVDHLIPLSRGGLNVLENMVLACKICNGIRGNALPHEPPTNKPPRKRFKRYTHRHKRCRKCGADWIDTSRHNDCCKYGRGGVWDSVSADQNIPIFSAPPAAPGDKGE